MPDYVEKMHQAAKTLDDWQKIGKWASVGDDDDQQNADGANNEEKVPM